MRRQTRMASPTVSQDEFGAVSNPPSRPPKGGVSEDHERIWLEPRTPDDRYGHEGRLWCQHKVWPDYDGQGEPTEYVRADLIRRNGTPRFNEAMRRAEAAEARAEARQGECDAKARIIADLEVRVERAEAALREIADYHIPDCPAHFSGDELEWAQRQHAHLRRLASAYFAAATPGGEK